MGHVLADVRVRKVADAAVAGTSAVEGSAVDTASAGVDVAFAATIATAASGNYLKAQQSADAAFTSPEDLASAGAKAIALVNGDVVAVEVYKPTLRYVRGVIVRGTSTATGEMYCLSTGGRLTPVDNNEASEIVSAIVNSPEAA